MIYNRLAKFLRQHSPGKVRELPHDLFIREGVMPMAWRMGCLGHKTTPRYDYYLVENTYVARYDRKTGRAERLMPDGTWVRSMRTREIFDGRPLEDEKDALDTASFLIARSKEREAAKRGGS